MSGKIVLGIDVGGSGIKGAPVDVEAGALLCERHKLDTPRPATPEAVVAAIVELAAQFESAERIGVTVPAVVKDGVAHTAANIDPAWIGFDIGALLESTLGGCPVTVMNDGDAAGLAEMQHGAGRGQRGTVIMLTLGTGIGSAVFVDGVLVPNTELGHMEVGGKEAEHRAAAQVRERDGLSWVKWTGQLSKVLVTIENLLWPDLFILGGGISRKHEKFLPLLRCRTPVVPAALGNDAGIVGAAMGSLLKRPFGVTAKKPI